MDFHGKMIGFRCLWGHAKPGIANTELKGGLSMESNMYALQSENDRIQVSLGVM